MLGMNQVQMNRVHTPRLVSSRAVRLLGLLLLLPALAGTAFAQADPDAEAQDVVAERIAERHRELHQKHGNDPDYFLKPGVIANRQDRTVTLHAWATGLGADSAVEFWVIPVESGKAYESLAVTPAKPSDIHAALAFVGMEPGRPVNYNRHQYWPKGERVDMTFRFNPGQAMQPKSFPAEALIHDKRTKTTLPEVGFVFTGSYTYEENGKTRYAADHSDSMSIASTYNERSTVLDTPRMAFQGDVYSYLLPAEPTHGLEAGQPIDITLKPARKPDNPRVIDLDLHVRADADVERAGRDALRFVIEGEGQARRELDTFTALTEYFNKLAEDRDPFVTFHLGENISLQAAHLVARLLREMEGEEGIRLEAPPEGQLYYLAWLPDAKNRARDNRPWRGHELHLRRQQGRLVGELIALRENYDASPPTTEAIPRTVRKAEDVAEVYDAAERGGQPLVIFAPPEVTVGELHDLIDPAVTQSDPIYIYLEDADDE